MANSDIATLNLSKYQPFTAWGKSQLVSFKVVASGGLTGIQWKAKHARV